MPTNPRYVYGGQHFITTTDLFFDYDYDKLKPKERIKGGYPRKLRKDKMCGVDSYSQIAPAVFLQALELIIDDLLETGGTFNFPTRLKTVITFQYMRKESLIKLMKNSDSVKHFDFIGRDFKLATPVVAFKTARRGQCWKRITRVEKKFLKKLVDKQNAGFYYC